MRRMFIAALGTLALILGFLAPAQATTTKLPQHSSIAAQPTAAGKWIRDIGVMGSTLYLGYGDYTANTGPIDVATVTTSGVTGIAFDNASTEALYTYRKIDGYLYAPFTDPRTCWACKQNAVVTNRGGTWRTWASVATVHLYDIVKAGNGDLVLVGSTEGSSTSGATAYVSKDGGATWKVGVVDHNNPPSGWERYYWAGVVDGKVYIKSSSGSFPMRVYDGTKWSIVGSANTRTFAGSGGQQVESYKTHIYSALGHTIDDRGRVTYQSFFSNFRDMFQYNGYLYGVRSNGEISRHDGTFTTGKYKYPVWKVVVPAGRIPETATSLAIVSGVYYLGTSSGNVFKVTS